MKSFSSKGGTLFFRPGEPVPVLFRPAAGVSTNAAVEYLLSLMVKLQEELGEAWQDDWLLPVWLLLYETPIEQLSRATDDELADSVQQWASAIRNMKRREPKKYEYYRRQAARELLKKRILADIYALDNTTGWSKGRVFVESRPHLLSAEADEVLEEQLASERARGDEKAIARLTQFRNLLRRSREIGIAPAFEEAQQEYEESTHSGRIPDELKDFEDARPSAEQIDKLRHALSEISRDDQPLQWARLQHQFGNDLSLKADPFMHRDPQDLREALQAFDRALEVITPELNKRDWAGIMLNKGNCYDALSETDNAIAAYEQAVRSFSGHGDRPWQAIVQFTLADTYLRLVPYRPEREDELWERAIQLYESARPWLVRENHGSEYPRTLAQLSSAYIERSERSHDHRLENIRLAYECLQEAMKTLRPDDPPMDVFIVGRTFGDFCYYEISDREGAWKGYQLAARALEDLYAFSATGDAQQKVLGLSTASHDSLMVVSMELKDAGPDYARGLLVYAEAAKARLFRDQLGHAEIPQPPGIDSALIDREQKLLKEIRNIDPLLLDATVLSPMKDQLIARHRQVRYELGGIWKSMEASAGASEYAALRQSRAPEWRELAELVEQLGRSGALVEFYTRSQNTYAMILRAGDDVPHAQILPLSNADLISKFVSVYVDEILRRPVLPYKPTHDWLLLGEELLAPLEPALEGTDLVCFVPHGVLHLLPLHALHCGGEPFIERRAVIYTSSAAALDRVLRRQLGRGSGVTMAALAYTPAETEQDVFVGEAEDVAALFGTTAIAGADASVATLRRIASQASRIHLSCHGYFLPGDPMKSSVALADGECTALDFMGMPLSASLVTMSACETGVPEVAAGDEVMSLTRSLLYAGASSALVTLWSVSAGTTREWMRLFYKPLADAEGSTKAHAFRDATGQLRKDYPDPYFWAPFTLVGDWR